MTLVIQFAPEAEDDLRALIEFLAERAPVAADKLADRILTLIEMIARGEIDGPEQRLTSGELVRSWPVPPVRVYYQRRPTSLWILRVYHQARTPLVHP